MVTHRFISVALSAAFGVAGCSGDEGKGGDDGGAVTCGAGTMLVGGMCVADGASGGSGAMGGGGSTSAGSGGSSGSAAPGAEGSACSAEQACGIDLFCAGFTCESTGTVGKLCGDNLPCDDPYPCVLWEPGEFRCGLEGDVGAPCDSDLDCTRHKSDLDGYAARCVEQRCSYLPPAYISVDFESTDVSGSVTFDGVENHFVYGALVHYAYMVVLLLVPPGADSGSAATPGVGWLRVVLRADDLRDDGPGVFTVETSTDDEWPLDAPQPGAASVYYADESGTWSAEGELRVEDVAYAIYAVRNAASEDPLDGEVMLGVDLADLALVDGDGTAHTLEGAIRVSGRVGEASPVPVAASAYGGWGKAAPLNFPDPELPALDGAFYCFDAVNGICTKITKPNAVSFDQFSAKCERDTGHPAQRHTCLPKGNSGVYLACDGTAFNVDGSPVTGNAYFMIGERPLSCDQAKAACESANGLPTDLDSNGFCDASDFHAEITGFPVECPSGVSTTVTIPAGSERCQDVYKEMAEDFSCNELTNYLSLVADYRSCVRPKFL